MAASVPSPSAAAPAEDAPSSSPAAKPLHTPVPVSYAVGDRTLSVQLIPEKPTFMASEPTHATLVFSAPKGAVEMEDAWEGRNALGRPENYRLVFIDARGARVPVPEIKLSFGGMSTHVVVKPEKDHAVRLLLPLWAERLTPGRYTIRCESTIPARAVIPGRPGAPMRALEVAIEAQVVVVPDDAKALDALVEAIGTRAVGDGDDASEAIRKLRAVRDRRVVAQWIRVSLVPEYEHKFWAARELAAWDEDRAFEVLVRVSRTRPEDLPAGGYGSEGMRIESAGMLRQTAAVALSTSQHRGALEGLLAMKADMYPAVRLTVLHRAAKLPDDEALPLLQAFATDSDEMVRTEAKRYLRERKH
jgi:hypothetical protein